MPVKLTMNQNWSNVKSGSFLAKGQLEMVTDIHKRSNILAPVLTGAMVNSSLIKLIGALTLAITYGNSRVAYARRQYFEHKTKSGYLGKAAESVLRGDIGKYWRGKI